MYVCVYPYRTKVLHICIALHVDDRPRGIRWHTYRSRRCRPCWGSTRLFSWRRSPVNSSCQRNLGTGEKINPVSWSGGNFFGSGVAAPPVSFYFHGDSVARGKPPAARVRFGQMTGAVTCVCFWTEFSGWIDFCALGVCVRSGLKQRLENHQLFEISQKQLVERGQTTADATLKHPIIPAHIGRQAFTQILVIWSQNPHFDVTWLTPLMDLGCVWSLSFIYPLCDEYFKGRLCSLKVCHDGGKERWRPLDAPESRT